MIIYFHIDELARDAVVASALKKELNRVGSKVVYGNRLTTNYVLRHFNVFDAIVLPSLAHFIDAFPDPDALPGNVFILQTEAIGQATGTLRRLNGKYFGDDAAKCEPWHRAVACFFLWGYSHINPFREFYPSYIDKCRVVGHPRLSNSCRKSTPKANGSKPVVGFVSRFNFLSPFDGRSPFESVWGSMKFGKEIFPLYENSDDKDVEDTFYTEVIDFRVMLEIMMSLDTSRFELSVRPHPRENRHGWVNLAEKLGLDIRVSPWDEPFGHWLQDVDFVISPPSTGLYDLLFHGKKPIVTNDIVPTRAAHILTESDDNNQILEGVCRPKSVSEVLSLIESDDIPVDQDVVGLRLREQVAADIAENSICNIIDGIEEFRPRSNWSDKSINVGFRRGLYSTLCFCASHLRWFKAVVQRRIEQGSTFHLTWQRARWIDRLTM